MTRSHKILCLYATTALLAIMAPNTALSSDLTPMTNATEENSSSDSALPQIVELPSIPIQVPEGASGMPGSAIPGSDSGETTGASVTSIPNLPPQPNLYYDGYSTVEQGSLQEPEPRKIDPAQEPARKYVVVTREAGAEETPALFAAAQAAMSQGNYEAAATLYERLSQKEPGTVMYTLGQARALHKAGHREAALGTYSRVLGRDPDNFDAQLGFASILSDNSPSEALRRLVDLQSRDADNVELISQLGLVQGKLGNVEEARRYFGMAAGLEPLNPHHVYNMAILYDKNKMYKQAIQTYEKALEMDSYVEHSRLPSERINRRLSVLRSL